MDTPAPPSPFWQAFAHVCWICRVLAITVFVVWHLFFLLVRNPLDVRSARAPQQPLPADLERAWRALDGATTTYGAFLRIEQGWSLFTPPLAREGEFLTVRLVFTDGDRVSLPSENEVDPSAFYLRRGGFRQRKLEDYLGNLASRDRDSPLLGAQVRARVARWRRRHPEEERTVERVQLVRCVHVFPPPGTESVGPREEVLATFDAAGGPWPLEAEP